MDNPKTQEEQSHDQHAVRLQKLQNLRDADADPYSGNCDQTHTSAQAKALYEKLGLEETEETVSVAGRIVTFRVMGKATFLKIQDREGVLQIYVKRDEVGEEEYKVFKKLDLGDIIGVTGPLFVTKTGEVTVRAHSYALVCKALRPLPEKWHGLSDNEQIYRQRYLDLIVNEQSRNRFRQRSAIIREIREFLWEREFIEVETPMLSLIHI